MKNFLFVAAGLFAFTACDGGKAECDSGEICETGITGDDSGATDDSGADDSGGGCATYDGATYIGIDESLCSVATDDDGNTPSNAIFFDCDADSWWYDIYTVGWASSMDLEIYQTGSSNPWDEYHPITSADEWAYDADGYWDNFYKVLDEVDSVDDVVDGSSTLYDCEQGRIDSLTWILTVYDMDGNEADCAVWGHDPSISSCDDWS